MDLIDLCEQHLTSNLTIESVVHVLLHADLCGDAHLKSKAIDFFTENTIQVKDTVGWKECGEKVIELLDHDTRSILLGRDTPSESSD